MEAMEQRRMKSAALDTPVGVRARTRVVEDARLGVRRDTVIISSGTL